MFSFLQENQKLRMEYELVQMENESLKLEVAKYVSASQKRKGDTHDSGDFNTFNETAIDSEGRVTGLLGSMEVPFLLNQEVQSREDRMKTYFRNKISELKSEKDELRSKTEHYVKEVIKTYFQNNKSNLYLQSRCSCFIHSEFVIHLIYL